MTNTLRTVAIAMQRRDYVAIALFVAAFVVSALLAAVSLAGYSVLLWGIACLLGWGTSATETDGGKEEKRRKRQRRSVLPPDVMQLALDV
jgi:hypothetical protein